jgi:hypothetical protein
MGQEIWGLQVFMCTTIYFYYSIVILKKIHFNTTMFKRRPIIIIQYNIFLLELCVPKRSNVSAQTKMIKYTFKYNSCKTLTNNIFKKLTLVSLPLQLMKAAVPAESYVIHLSSASLVSCDVYGQ